MAIFTNALLPFVAGSTSGWIAATWIERWYSAEAFGPLTGTAAGVITFCLVGGLSAAFRVHWVWRFLGAAAVAGLAVVQQRVLPTIGADRATLAVVGLAATGALAAAGIGLAVGAAGSRGLRWFLLGASAAVFAEPWLAAFRADRPLDGIFGAAIVLALVGLASRNPAADERAVDTEIDTETDTEAGTETDVEAGTDDASPTPRRPEPWRRSAAATAALAAGFAGLVCATITYGAMPPLDVPRALAVVVAVGALTTIVARLIGRRVPLGPWWAGLFAIAATFVATETWLATPPNHPVFAERPLAGAVAELPASRVMAWAKDLSLSAPTRSLLLAVLALGGLAAVLWGFALSRVENRVSLAAAGIGAGGGALLTLPALPYLGLDTAWAPAALLGIAAFFTVLTVPGTALARALGLLAVIGGTVAFALLRAEALPQMRDDVVAEMNAMEGTTAHKRPPSRPYRAIAELSLAVHPAPKRILVLGSARIASAIGALTNARVDAFDLTTARDKPHRPPRGILRQATGRYDVVVDAGAPEVSPRRERARTRALTRALAPGGRGWRWLDLARTSAERTGAMVRSFVTSAPFVMGAWRARTPTWERIEALGLLTAADEETMVIRTWRDDLGGDAWRRIRDGADVIARFEGGRGALESTYDALRNPKPDDDASTVTRLLTERRGPHVEDGAPETLPWTPSMTTALLTTPAAVQSAFTWAGTLRRESAANALTVARRALTEKQRAPFVLAYVDRAAKQAMKDNRTGDVAALYTHAATVLPSWAGAYVGESRLAFQRRHNFKKKDWEALNKRMERALQLDPTNAEAWAYQGAYYWESAHDAERARSCFENARSLEPDAILPKRYLWHYAERDGRIVEAAQMLLDAVDADESDVRSRDALYKITPRLVLQGEPARALAALDRVARWYRRDAGFFLTRSQVLDALGRLDDAIDAARKACTLTQPVQGYFLHLYKLLVRGGRTREASETAAYMKQQFRVDAEALANQG